VQRIFMPAANQPLSAAEAPAPTVPVPKQAVREE
jgi:hypothetical protein